MFTVRISGFIGVPEAGTRLPEDLTLSITDFPFSGRLSHERGGGQALPMDK